jgi:hypothetical protein
VAWWVVQGQASHWKYGYRYLQWWAVCALACYRGHYINRVALAYRLDDSQSGLEAAT